MSIINNNDFTLSTTAQAAIESICTNLDVQDITVGCEYNGLYPLFDYITDSYVGSINIETLEFIHDLSGFVDSFFSTGVFVLGERDSEIENSENVRIAVIEELEKRLQLAKIENVIYVNADEIEAISRENNYESVVTHNNCIFELEWDIEEDYDYNLIAMQFISCTDFGGNLLHDTDHENGGQVYNGVEFDLAQCAGGSFSDYAYLKGAKAVVEVSHNSGTDLYYLGN